MTVVHYKGEVFEPREGETLLQMFLRRGVKVPHSCGGGSCHFCLHRCVSGDIPAAAQKTLRKAYKDSRFFLLCCCTPTSDMVIELPRRAERFVQMEIASLNDGGEERICTLMPYSALSVKAGQYLRLISARQQRVSFHITGVSVENGAVQGNVIGALSTPLAVGEVLEAQGPFSDFPPVVDMAEGVSRAYPEPIPALWKALDNGATLREILKVFYHRVFRDPLLAPFFTSVTESRLAEKQYNFLCQAITGEKVFFGERPRNSHHWMVISDEIFDHRTAILRQVLDEFALPTEACEQLIQVEEHYRQDIVKDRPWEKILFGKAVPVEGYEELIMDEASLCDGCQAAIDKGNAATYHVRTGKLYCQACRNP